MADEKDNLKNLPPEERIKRLKELEAKRKKEIEEAQKVIKESEAELTERRKWVERVPIPEFAREELADLSEEGKQILKQRGLREKLLQEEIPQKKKAVNLEETVERERIEIPLQIQESMYTQQLSQRSVKELQNEVMGVYKAVEEKGYMSPEEERKIEYRISAIEEKRKSGYAFTEEAARAASMTEQVGAKLLYKSLKESYQA